MPSSRAELILDPLALRELAFVARIADQVPRIAETAAEVPVGGGFSAITQHVAERTGLPAADVERVLLCCRTCSASGQGCTSRPRNFSIRSRTRM